MLPVSV